MEEVLNIEQKERQIITEWQAQITANTHYEYLITEGKKLISETDHSKCYYLWSSCQSDVFLHHKYFNNRFYIYGYSSSLIVSGMLKQVLYLYHGSSPKVVKKFHSKWLQIISCHLTFQRKIGLQTLEKHIQKTIIKIS